MARVVDDVSSPDFFLREEGMSVHRLLGLVVQDDLNRVVQWMESSRLILNQSKYKIKCPLQAGKILPKHQILVYSHIYGKTLERVPK